MKIPVGATSFAPKPSPVLAGHFRGGTIRHTFRPHGSRDWLMIWTLGGGGLYRFDGGTHRSRSNEITLYRPGAFQDYQIAPDAGKWDLLFAHFLPRPDWRAWLDWPEIGPGLARIVVTEPTLRRRLQWRWKEIIRLQAGAPPRGRLLAVNALEEVLLWCDSANAKPAGAPSDPRVARAMDFLAANLAQPFAPEKLARAAGLSPSRLRHLFHQQTGQSPRDFLEQQRLARARQLLAMSRSTLGEIAQETGFASPFYFSLRFKKEMGESPRDYRRRQMRGLR